MMASVPSRALPTAPETGASTIGIFFAARATPSARVPVGSEELMSITTAPAFSAGSASSTTSRTTSPSGSMVTSASAPLAASRTDLRLPLPAASNDCTAKPARARLAAIGSPIMPRPTKATVLTLEDLFGAAEGDDRGRHAAVNGRLQQHFLDLVLG